jgi:hypothetical protein
MIPAVVLVVSLFVCMPGTPQTASAAEKVVQITIPDCRA